MQVTQTIPGAMFDKVCDSGLIANGNNEIAMTKKSRGLRKLDGFLSDIFKSLVSVLVKIFTEWESVDWVSCIFDGLWVHKFHHYHSVLRFEFQSH